MGKSTEAAKSWSVASVLNLPFLSCCLFFHIMKANLPVSFAGNGHAQTFNAPDDLPKTVMRTLNQGSNPMSMDFHPIQQTLLLVGTDVGEIGLWEVGSRERLVSKNFKVWHLNACSMPSQVWDAGNGARQYTFAGHEAPVFSVCPYYKENIQYFFSASIDGRVKIWQCDNMRSRVDFEAPGRWCTTMAYSADGTRIFSCGTSKNGESYIVEWSGGNVQRTYRGFRNRSLGVVQFDTTKNRFLAAGDNFSIKFWDMDNVQLLTTVDADGGLPACPRIRFNKDGTLLAVSGNENGIKILANVDGMRLLRTFDSLSNDLLQHLRLGQS
uniref:Uncharacterized protein n=1 Tax=Cucumis sativus TaxID=3659 RepID=A0A0A0KYJ9_CUCSA